MVAKSIWCRPLATTCCSTLIRPMAPTAGAQRCLFKPQLWVRRSTTFDRTVRAEQARQIDLRAKLKHSAGVPEKYAFRRLFALVRGERWPLAAALMLLLVSSGVTLSLPWVIGKLLDCINNPNPDKELLGMPLNYFFLGMSGVFIVGSMATFGRIMTLRLIGERMVSRLRSRTFKNIISQDAEFFDANRTGDLISRLSTDANVVSRAVTQNIADGLRSVINATLGVSMMCYISFKLTSIITVILPPVMIATYLYGRRVRGISRDFQWSLGHLTRVAEERLNNVGTSRAFGAETQEISLYNKHIRRVFSIAMKDARATGIYSGAMQLTGNMVIIGLLSIGASMVSSGSLSFGALSSFIMYTAYAGSAISGMGNFYSELMKGAGAASRLFEVEDCRPAIPPFQGQSLKNPYGDIVFKDVTFSYPTRPAVRIFNGLNLQIKSGSHVCLVGQSGGGKSTVLSLLLRFYDPVSGSVHIGDQNLKEVSPWNVRRHIGVVSQDPVLFSATVADNIAYAKPDATREEIMKAAMQANCTFLADFPDGIDTQVGPRGAQLSGGQKQRIAIARAIINKPAILVLDEATSALDGESEALVNQALSKLIHSSSTTISVAHRLSTIARSEEVVVIGSNGTAIEHGRFRDLYNDPTSALSELLRRRDEVPPLPSHTKAPEDETEPEQSHDHKDRATNSTEG